MKKMDAFFYDTYKGFYCTICDAGSHKYFNLDKNEVVFSEKFCRDIIENTLTSLLFFHVHINKYANLVSKFLLSCDKKGDYQPNVKIPLDVIFLGDEIVEKNL